MLYQVADTNIQVAGVMHVVPVGSPCLPDWLSKAHDECEVFVTEHDLGDTLPHTSTGTDNGVRALVEPWVWQDLIDLWGDESTLARQKPWWIMMNLGSKFYEQVQGAETLLLERPGKERYFLESGEQLSAFFDAVPPADYLWQLAVILENRAATPGRFKRMYEAWWRRDLLAMDELTRDGQLAIPPGLRQAAFTQRNRLWMRGFPFLHQLGRRVLVAVGALHLCGDGGMVQLAENSQHAFVKLL